MISESVLPHRVGSFLGAHDPTATFPDPQLSMCEVHALMNTLSVRAEYQDQVGEEDKTATCKASEKV
jgi:hypothetical protein